LGSVVYGIDEETLEDAALKAASGRDWKLVAVESGLGGVLKHRLAQSRVASLLAVESAEMADGKLSVFLKATQEKYSANAALGVAVFPAERTVELALITPEGTRERRLSFGGHPALLPRWTVNIALNWLRRAAEGDN
jgi:hypothetical protein